MVEGQESRGRQKLPVSALEASLALRERLADKYDIDFGRSRLFPQLIEALIEEVPEGGRLLEVGAATGILTRPLLECSGHVTAMEPSSGLLKHLLASEVAESPRLSIRQGMVEDLLHDDTFDVAVVTFTPRRGIDLYNLFIQLAIRVRNKVVFMLDDDGSLDWAYLARSIARQGVDVRVRIVTNEKQEPEFHKRSVLLAVVVARWRPMQASPTEQWGQDATRIVVPYPVPRGTATRLIRYFLSGGSRALFIDTDPRGLERLYGNLRTAAHRLAREELTVRLQGEAIQVVRLPKGKDASFGKEVL